MNPACILGLVLALGCSSPKPSGGSGAPTGGSGTQTSPAGKHGAIAMDDDDLLDNAKHAIPDASGIEDVTLGAPGLRAYWIELAGGPPNVDRGVGVVSPDGKAFSAGGHRGRREGHGRPALPIVAARRLTRGAEDAEDGSGSG